MPLFSLVEPNSAYSVALLPFFSLVEPNSAYSEAFLPLFLSDGSYPSFDRDRFSIVSGYSSYYSTTSIPFTLSPASVVLRAYKNQLYLLPTIYYLPTICLLALVTSILSFGSGLESARLSQLAVQILLRFTCWSRDNNLNTK